MSMKALNQLVGRSIVDPAVVNAFEAGSIGEMLAELGFEPEMVEKLSGLRAETWAEYAVLAYRVVKAAERAQVELELPSPVEGLRDDETGAGKEQVA